MVYWGCRGIVTLYYVLLFEMRLSAFCYTSFLICVLVKLGTKCQYWQMQSYRNVVVSLVLCMSEACKDVYVELCSFALSTPGIIVVTVGPTFEVLICENKMNHFALKAGKMPYFLLINFCQLRIKILNFLYCGVGSHILIWGNSLFSRYWEF